MPPKNVRGLTSLMINHIMDDSMTFELLPGEGVSYGGQLYLINRGKKRLKGVLLFNARNMPE